MKRFRRIFLRLVVGLTVVIGAGLVATLDGVDHRPYLREPYCAETSGRTLATNSLARGDLSAGFGQALFTPT